MNLAQKGAKCLFHKRQAEYDDCLIRLEDMAKRYNTRGGTIAYLNDVIKDRNKRIDELMRRVLELEDKFKYGTQPPPVARDG